MKNDDLRRKAVEAFHRGYSLDKLLVNVKAASDTTSTLIALQKLHAAVYQEIERERGQQRTLKTP